MVLPTFLSLVVLFVAQLSYKVNADPDTEVDPQKCLVWGPGLTGGFVVPARYFMIQLVDKKGNNITSSIGAKPFTLSIQAKSHNDRVRVWIRDADRQDGSYIIQYKLYSSSPTGLNIEILLNNRQVGKSPYQLEGPVYQEKCYCPEPSLKTWMETMTCPASYRQIKQDLSLFSKVNMELIQKEIVQRFNKAGSHSLCHYVVKDNKIYRKTHGQHVGFKMFMDAILLSLTRKVHLPDIEFFVNLGDWPLEKRKVSENPLPIFSWCGSDDTLDIIMPTYDMTESTLETMGRVTLDLVSVQGAHSPTWHNKTSLAFWRGRDSRQERLDLVQMSMDNPEIIDARLTNVFFFKEAVKSLAESVKHISFFDFFQHKYQLNIDGTVAAYRLPYLLGGTSVVFKQESPYYEYFYKRLEPYVHYIPFKRDLSDLMDQIQWAKDHDKEAYQISLNGRQFVLDNLLAADVMCYHVVLFQEYAKRLVRAPTVQEDMELVPQPDDADSQCQCHRKPQKSKDEL